MNRFKIFVQKLIGGTCDSPTGLAPRQAEEQSSNLERSRITKYMLIILLKYYFFRLFYKKLLTLVVVTPELPNFVI